MRAIKKRKSILPAKGRTNYIATKGGQTATVSKKAGDQLNVSYKIASGCIANRIKRVLPNIIHSDQTGFINDRCISENTRLLYDIIHYTEKINIPGLLLLIDFEKAFDSVSWPFIKETFSFGPDIRKWIDIIYKNTKPCVVINGQVST